MRAAGRALGLSQPTIARRLVAFEASFGGTALLDRLPEGLRLNAVGEQLVPAAESIRTRCCRSSGGRGSLTVLCGTVRISTGECAAGFLARCLSGSTRTALSARHHGGTGRRVATTPRTSRDAKPIWRCATRRPKAATSTSPGRAPSPVPSTGVAAPTPAHG